CHRRAPPVRIASAVRPVQAQRSCLPEETRWPRRQANSAVARRIPPLAVRSDAGVMTQFTHDTAPTQYVDAGGTRFAYRRFGVPGRPPLVFFQHFMGNLDDHDPALSDAFA